MSKFKISRREFFKTGAAVLVGSAALNACGSDVEIETVPEDVELDSGPDIELDTGPYADKVNVVSLRLLWTGDIHGQIRPIYHRDAYGADFLKQNGIKPGSVEAYITTNDDYENLAKKYGKVGGMANIAALINQERAHDGDTILLDSGDAWYGSAIALLTEMRAPVEVMNAIGYDAMTLHWEFNMGQDIFLDRVDDSEVAVIAQNLVDTDFEDRVLEPSIFRELADGTKVAIVGEAFPFSLLTTEDRDINPGMRMGYRDIELQEEIDRVRNEEGAQIVILLTHMGLDQDRVMATRLTGVDIMVGGHSHDILWYPEVINGIILMHGGSHGKILGKLDIEIQDGKIVGFEHRLIPVLAEEITPDPKIEALIESLYQPFEEELSRVVGETESVLYRSALHGGTTDRFVGEAYRQIIGSDVSCTPGWRFGSTLIPGAITVEDVYNCMKPTSSPLYTATLNGSRILLSIEDNFDNVFNPDPMLRFGGDTLRCTGIETEYIRDNPRLERITSAKINGKTLGDTDLYTIATSGGRTQYLDPEVKSTERPAVEELIDFIEANSPISAPVPIEAFKEAT